MEKQLRIFQHLEDCSTVWDGLPEENRRKIEGIFAESLIGRVASILEEVKSHDK